MGTKSKKRKQEEEKKRSKRSANNVVEILQQCADFKLKEGKLLAQFVGMCLTERAKLNEPSCAHVGSPKPSASMTAGTRQATWPARRSRWRPSKHTSSGCRRCTAEANREPGCGLAVCNPDPWQSLPQSSLQSSDWKPQSPRHHAHYLEQQTASTSHGEEVM